MAQPVVNQERPASSDNQDIGMQPNTLTHPLDHSFSPSFAPNKKRGPNGRFYTSRTILNHYGSSQTALHLYYRVVGEPDAKRHSTYCPTCGPTEPFPPINILGQRLNYTWGKKIGRPQSTHPRLPYGMAHEPKKEPWKVLGISRRTYYRRALGR